MHLVPTGFRGSVAQDIEWRVSFSRAEVVSTRHLNPAQHAKAKASKSIKNAIKKIIKKSELTGLKLPMSYYTKMVALWLARASPVTTGHPSLKASS